MSRELRIISRIASSVGRFVIPKSVPAGRRKRTEELLSILDNGYQNREIWNADFKEARDYLNRTMDEGGRNLQASFLSIWDAQPGGSYSWADTASKETVVRNFGKRGEESLGSILFPGQSKAAARPIRLDKAMVKREVKELADEVWRRLKRMPQDEPVGQFVLNFNVVIRNTDGENIETVIVVKMQPSSSVDLVPGGGTGKAVRTGQPAIVVLLNGRYNPPVFNPKASRFMGELYGILLHEFTHIADKYKGGGPTTRHVKTLEEMDAEKYYNRPSEVRAYMQQIVDEVRKYFPKIRKHFDRKESVHLALRTSQTWKEVEPYLNRRNRNRILNAVWNSIQDLMEGQGMEKAARELMSVARELLSADAPDWTAPEFDVPVVPGARMKRYNGTYKGQRIWVLKGGGKVYKDPYGWISMTWMVNPIFEGNRWVVRSTLSFAPATSGSFAREKFEEFKDDIRIPGEADTTLFGIHSRALDEEPDMSNPMRAVELVIGRHAKSLKEAMGFWKQQAAEFKRGQGR
jgi:hypothetical protein